MGAGDRVICPECGVIFNANKEPSVKIKRRYYHKECFEKLGIEIPKETEEVKPKRKASEKQCYYCKQYFDIEKEEYAKPLQNKYAHKKCYEQNYKPDEEFIDKIYEYLGKELMIKYDYLQCERQRTTFIKKNGYTNEGILLALKYFYEVKKQSADRSGNRIGIVPYVYDEAQTYYKELNKQKKKINDGLKKQLNKKAVVITVHGEQKEKEKDYIDIDKIGG